MALLLPTTLNARVLGVRETLWLTATFVLAGLPHLLRLPLWIGVDRDLVLRTFVAACSAVCG